MSYNRGMEFFLIVLAVLVVLKILFPPSYRVTILYRPDEPPRAPPPKQEEPPPRVDTGRPTPPGEPLTVDPDKLREMPSQAQADLFRAICRDHMKLIAQAVKKKDTARARELVASLRRQFPDATIDGLDELERRLDDIDRTGKWKTP